MTTDEALAAVQRVRDLHTPARSEDDCCDHCSECWHLWPCDTLAWINGRPEQDAVDLRRLHQRVANWCDECGNYVSVRWPCPTILALEGTGS